MLSSFLSNTPKKTCEQMGSWCKISFQEGPLSSLFPSEVTVVFKNTTEVFVNMGVEQDLLLKVGVKF